MGGSLASVLKLMFVHRGLPPAALLPAYAFNSPPVLCQVPDPASWSSPGGYTDEQLSGVVADMAALLAKLALPQDAVKTIMLPAQASNKADAAAAASGGLDGGLKWVRHVIPLLPQLTPTARKSA